MTDQLKSIRDRLNIKQHIFIKDPTSKELIPGCFKCGVSNHPLIHVFVQKPTNPSCVQDSALFSENEQPEILNNGSRCVVC